MFIHVICYSKIKSHSRERKALAYLCNTHAIDCVEINYSE